MKTRILLFVFSIVLFSACEDMLVEEPLGLLAPGQFFNVADEAISATNGCYASVYEQFNMNISEFSNHGTDLMGPTRLLSRLNYHNYTMSVADVGRFHGYWLDCYNSIGKVNLTINRIQQSDIREEVKKQTLGEAYFLRAFYYYYLSICFGDVPMWLDELDVETVSELSNTPIDQIRTQMLADLTIAETDLASEYDAKDNGRASKWAAKALMVKIYLDQQEWQLARDKAADIINNSPHVLLDNYADVFSIDYNAETIWEIDYVRDIKGSGWTSRYCPRGKDEPGGLGVSMTGFGLFCLYPSFANSYDPLDERRATCVLDSIGGVALNWIYMPKYAQLDEPRGNSGDNFIVYRLADFMLIQAEAENELNGPANAYTYLNQVRARAGLPALSGLSQSEFRDAIMQERAWELCGENWRRWDLIRWGKLVEAVQGTALDNASGAANIQPHHVRFPIPYDEILKNPNLTQTPGY